MSCFNMFWQQLKCNNNIKFNKSHLNHFYALRRQRKFISHTLETQCILCVYQKPHKIYDLTVLAFITFTFPLNGSTLDRLFFRCNDTIWPFVYRRYTRAGINPACACVFRFIPSTVLHYARATRYIAPRDKPEAFLSRRSLTRTTGDRKSVRFYSHAENQAASVALYRSGYSNFSSSHFQGRTSTLEHAFAKSSSAQKRYQRG